MGLILGCLERRLGFLPTGVLGLTPDQAIAFENSWKSISVTLPDFGTKFFMWETQMKLICPHTSNESHPEISDTPGATLQNSEFKVLTEEFLNDIDNIVTNLPKLNSKTLDLMCKSYLERGQTQEEFENLAYSLLDFLRMCGTLTALAEMAWLIFINRISSHMWYYIRQHALTKEGQAVGLS